MALLEFTGRPEDNLLFNMEYGTLKIEHPLSEMYRLYRSHPSYNVAWNSEYEKTHQ
jgi:hypothetical protein